MASSEQDQIAAMLECSLCLSVFKKPKCLPCLHTFCLDCLQNYVVQSKIAAEIPCPLCRETFSIPSQDLSSLRDNFFILSMIQLRGECKSDTSVTLDSDQVIKCDECLEEKGDSDCPSATSYCVECEQNFCNSCSLYHGRKKKYGSHKVVLVELKAQAIKNVAQNIIQNCDKHENEPFRLYCRDCDKVVCVVCMLSEHTGHNCEAIKEASSSYRNKINTSLLALQDILLFGQTSFEKLKAMENGVIKETEISEKNIKEQCAKTRRTIDEYERELLNEVQNYQSEKVKEVRHQCDEVQFQNGMLQNLICYLNEIKEKGSDFDVSYSGKKLLLRSEHLQASSALVFTRKTKVTYLNFLPQISEEIVKTQVGRIAIGEKLLIAIGLNIPGSTVKQKVCHISVDNPDTITVINSTPAEIPEGSAAGVINNILYAVGIGRAYNEMWAWSAKRDEWTKCANLTSSRYNSCVTSVGDKIYVLGGKSHPAKIIHDRILCYDINTNTWTEPGKLYHAVSSATCVTYKHCIYVFGGIDKYSKDLNHVQVYDTATNNISLHSNPMPGVRNPIRIMRAVLWRSKSLLIGEHTCYIYDFESDVWLERLRFKTNVRHFSLTLDDEKLYISGGGTKCTDKQNKMVWKCRDSVMSLSVDDFLSDKKEANWRHHAKLPVPALVASYSPVPILK